VDAGRFDTLTRTVASRRRALSALSGLTLFGFLNEAIAGKRRRKKKCRVKKIKVTCTDSCAFHNISNCRRFDVQCKCGGGKTCLATKSCGRSCDATPDCPEGSGCTCSASAPKVCLEAFTNCEDVPTTCQTTADCPFRSVCEETADCGEGGTPEKRCQPLCGYAPIV
jgi:hypothetical protein